MLKLGLLLMSTFPRLVYYLLNATELMKKHSQNLEH